MRLYSMPSSGNSYKVRLLLALTGRHCERIDLESATPELEEVKQRGLLPFGKLPALELDDGSFLAESNALLIYFGEGSSFVPSDAATRGRMFAWMFWEQNNHEPVIAVRAALLPGSRPLGDARAHARIAGPRPRIAGGHGSAPAASGLAGGQ